MKSIKTFSLVLLVFVLNSGYSQNDKDYLKRYEDANFPKSIGFINDFENVFSAEERTEMEGIILQFETVTTNQIALITIDSIDPYEDIADYATDLGNYWGVGQEEKDNGILIVLSTALRKVFIATGLGMEQSLTDEEAKLIIDNFMIPSFKENEYFKGTKEGILAIIEEIK